MPPSASGARGDGDIPQPRVAQKGEGVCTCGKKCKRKFYTLATAKTAAEEDTNSQQNEGLAGLVVLTTAPDMGSNRAPGPILDRS